MSKALLRLRISVGLLLSIFLVMPFVNEWVMGADKDGNHWGTVFTFVLFFFVWLPAGAVFLGLWSLEAALRKKGKARAATAINIINLFIPIIAYAISVYLLLTQ